jgi:hypothetical protein
MIAAGIAWDRWASGFPVVRYPKNGGAAALEKAEELGRAIRNHEHAYAAFEGGPPTDLNGDDGWDITIQGGAGVLPDPTPLMIRYELAIYGAGLMQWMALGTSSKTGARATAQVQDEPFYVFLEAFAGDVAAARQRQVLRRFVDVNFGTEYATPELTVSKIQSEDVEKLARTLGELRTAGFNLSYRELQNYVMTLAHLPGLPETLPRPVRVKGCRPSASRPCCRSTSRVAVEPRPCSRSRSSTRNGRPTTASSRAASTRSARHVPVRGEARQAVRGAPVAPRGG